jgi:DNA mismatch repair protein MutL
MKLLRLFPLVLVCQLLAQKKDPALTPSLEEDLKESALDKSEYRIVGQIANKFIVLEHLERVIFLDQHAVHERARFDELMTAFKTKKKQSQTLLLPEIINLTASEFAAFSNVQDFFTELGFAIEEFGTSTIKVSALPQQISSDNLKETILQTVEEIGDFSSSEKSLSLDENVEKALTYLSCRGSVMFGDKLQLLEMEAILELWLKHAKGLTCPHGRPLAFEMSISEMEKRVGR